MTSFTGAQSSTPSKPEPVSEQPHPPARTPSHPHSLKAVGPWLALAASILLFPPTGIAAAYAFLRARRLMASNRRAARASMEAFRQRCWYSVGIAAGLYIVGLLVAILTYNDFTVAKAFFDPHSLSASSGQIALGFEFTIKLFLIAEVFILAWALVIALVRSLPGPAAAPARWLAIAYTDVFRALPMLLVILMVDFGLPDSDLPVLKSVTDFQAAVIALTLTYGAYVAEIFRAGIESVHWSQTAAARSLGFSWIQSMRYVIVPQGVKNMLPALMNAFISLQKDTSLVSVIGLLDALNRGRIQSINMANLSPYTGVAIGFLVLTLPTTRLTDYYIRRRQRRQSVG